MSGDVRRNAPQFAHLLPWEDEGAYAARLDELAAAYRPQGPVERALVERLALLLQRRDRLALAERAVHLKALDEAVEQGHHLAKLTRRAGVATGAIEAPDSLTDVLVKSEADDANEREELAQDRDGTRRAIEILKSDAGDAYEQALAVVDEETLGGWRDWLEDGQYEEEPKYVATAESFKTFLETDITSWEERAEAEIAARPALRLQAFGESVDPFRLERLLAIDTRIDRQLEKALAMLIKLQELRGKAKSD